MTFNYLILLIIEDVRFYGGNSLKEIILIFFFNVPFKLLLNFRIGSYLVKRRNLFNNLIILWLKRRQIRRYHCDISYDAAIGKRLSIPHPIGIVVGAGVVIRDNVMIWQNVTLGSHGKVGDKKVYPVIESGVKLYSGCQILGPIVIGEYAVVGAGSIVLKDVPNEQVAVGIPARIISR